jgi:phosphomevalonate kinase
MEHYAKHRTNIKVQNDTFNHFTNRVCQSFWQNEKACKPSPYLDAFMTDKQAELLQPAHKNVLMGHIVYDSKGEGAVQKVAKRRIDVISGNINSYSRVLNDPNRLAMIEEVNRMAAAVAEVSADIDTNKRQRTEAAAEKAAAIAKKKIRKELEEAAKAEELRPKLEAVLKPFLFGPETVKGLNNLSKSMLQDLIQYYYKSKPTGLRTMKKEDLVVTLAALIREE